MIPDHLRFSRLKRRVSIEQVLAHRGLLARMRRQAHTLSGSCPIHCGDNPRAFVVSRSKNLWRCFTACDAGGDVVELVRRLDRCSYRQVAEYLSSLACEPYPTRPPIEPIARPPKPFAPFRRRLPLDPTADFLRHKAIQPHTARRFEAGLYRGPGFPGNVWEWGRDLWDADAYRNRDRQQDPVVAGREGEDTAVRVVRGGSWADPDSYLPAAFRLGYPAWDRNGFLGFRVVCRSGPEHGD